MKKLLLVMTVACFVGVLAGCETIKGVGQDIENTGNNIWETVNR